MVSSHKMLMFFLFGSASFLFYCSSKSRKRVGLKEGVWQAKVPREGGGYWNYTHFVLEPPREKNSKRDTALLREVEKLGRRLL
jgi:hypothetical protein